MRVSRRDLRNFFIYALCAGVVVGVVGQLFGPAPAIIANIGAMAITVILVASTQKRRIKEQQIEQWRETHPDVSEEYLPEHLKGKA